MSNFSAPIKAESHLPKLTPTQQKALDELLAAVASRAAPLLELRSPPALARGHGVTTVLRAAAACLGVPLLGVAAALQTATECSEECLAHNLYAAAVRSLEEHGVAIIDDLDLAVAPRSLRRSRTLVGAIRGAGDMYNWEVGPKPAMLLKALADSAATVAGQPNRAIIFASLEDAHLAFMQSPLSVVLGEPTEADYSALLGHVPAGILSKASPIDAAALFALHSQLAPGALLNAVGRAAVAAAPAAREGSGVGTAELLAAVRGELVETSAVAPEEVEPVDLATFPGLGNIKEELERQVLFPLENPELATELGLAPKRGVLIHGSPGTGKTTVGRWLAHRLKGKFFLVREMMVQADIIKVFAAAKAAAPAVVFIDDADIVVGGWRPLDGGRGSDIFRFLLGHMDGLTSRGERQRQNGDVVVMLTGQNVQWMAQMLLRSGRIELWLKTKLPGPKEKKDILRKYIQEDAGALRLLGKDGALPDVRAAAQASDSFCCADLRRIVNDAKVLAAWDRRQAEAMPSSPQPTKDGAAYLEEAAAAVRQMKNDVEENVRRLYA